MPKRIVVTGGAGFIGANLCRRLEEAGDAWEVVALDDLSTGRPENLAGCGATKLLEGSILDDSDLDAALEGAAAIVHLAARPSVPRSLADPMATHEVNATGTMKVLEAARRNGANHVVVASSSSVYGANPKLPKSEDMVPMPVSPYAVSKLATESYALAYGRCFGLDVLALRFFNVFGPLQHADHAYAAVVPAFLSAAVEGRALPVHGDGTQTRDFTFVDTVTAIIASALSRRVSHDGPVNLAFGSRVSLLQLISVIEKVMGRQLEKHHGTARAGDVHDSQADRSLLESLFPGIAPVPLEEGIRATVRWWESLL